MSFQLQLLVDALRAQRERYERTKVASSLLSAIARKLPEEFFSSPSSYVEPLEPLDALPPRVPRFPSAAQAKRWVFENFDEFVWIGVDGSQIMPSGMTRQGLAVQTGICVYSFEGKGRNKHNVARQWRVVRAVTTPRPGFLFPDVNSERYIQEIEHARCIVSYMLDGKFPCDECMVRLDYCPNRMQDLSPLSGKENVMLMVDFPLEPSWIKQTMGRFGPRRELLIQVHKRILDLRRDIFLVGITHGSLAKDYISTIIDQFDDALWEKVPSTQMQDLIRTIENWKDNFPEEAEELVREWAERTGHELGTSPLAYLTAILESPEIRGLITDFDGLGSYFDASGDRSPAFKCKRKDMEDFGFGYVTGYYFMPWGGFLKEDGCVRANDWIRVGFGIRRGLGERGDSSLIDSLHGGVIAQIILGHGTPLVLSRAHLLAADYRVRKRLTELMIRVLGAYPTHKTLRKVKTV
ncbi:MAG: hypothetical protein DRO18_04165 [Thermoprotei archaeon]|nr:MAG: hypothetical protein DRO18_04165 [Thermoprotei archaeon]